ncbi:MAG: hypothetical protein EOO36_00570 [Cytophagaceae bacterium]|nr:MAG: hypothetical protein EOO36_00570 [Cytophagaceae bacterium]
MATSGFSPVPYHARVPLAGEWGYVRTRHLAVCQRPPADWAAPRLTSQMRSFPPDTSEVPAEVNQFTNQALA